MLMLAPTTLRAARKYVKQHHRHHKPSVGAMYALAVIDGAGKVRGVCTVGKPVARALNDGYTVEVTRVATDGARNACSMLLGGARRAAFALGYAKIVTYTLSIEGGASLRGAGWTREADVKGRSWSCESRPRDDKHPLIDKVRWSATRDRPKPVIDWGGDA